MKKKLLLSVLLICSLAVSGQENLSLKIEKSDGRTAGAFWKAVTNRSLTSFTGGYQRTEFFNTFYYNNVENGTIKNKGGFWLTYSIHVAPVMLDISYFRSFFEVESNGYYYEYPNKSTYQHGVSAFVSYAPLLPDFGKFSEIVQPYARIGYQTSSLKVVLSEEEGDSTNIASLGTSGMMWKGGIKLHFGKFCIRGEYQQSLSVTKPSAFNLIQIGIGFGI
jgi:hypothetical protein